MSAQRYHRYIPIWLLLGISAVRAPTIAQAESAAKRLRRSKSR
jgi:hypothetical protein